MYIILKSIFISIILVTKGLEGEQLPNWIIDEYTNVTFKWAFNEPVIRLPGTGLLLTVGRSLLLGIGGLLVGSILFFLQKAQWFLPVHCVTILFVYIFLRVMNLPQQKRN